MSNLLSSLDLTWRLCWYFRSFLILPRGIKSILSRLQFHHFPSILFILFTQAENFKSNVISPFSHMRYEESSIPLHERDIRDYGPFSHI